jgi:hydrogenase nickel incorporation protein HypA/HybF
MHEYSLARALIERVETEARAHRATTVLRLTVRIGPLAGVERELFATAFRNCRPGTLCADAALVIRGEEAVWRCEVCGEAIPAGSELCCPVCAMPARLAGGDSLVLERVEMEVLGDV